jgi:hypothetical protein
MKTVAFQHVEPSGPLGAPTSVNITHTYYTDGTCVSTSSRSRTWRQERRWHVDSETGRVRRSVPTDNDGWIYTWAGSHVDELYRQYFMKTLAEEILS